MRHIDTHAAVILAALFHLDRARRHHQQLDELFVRQRIHRRCCSEMFPESWHQDTLHQARFSLRERLQRIFKPKTSRRVAERLNLLLAKGSAGTHRTMAHSLQHAQAAQRAGIQTTGTTDDPATLRRSALGI